jgi:hypothetical protein
MKKIAISAELEREIKAYPRNCPVSATEIMDKLIKLLDFKEPLKLTTGISYAEILQIFREEVGARLAVPPKPGVAWIVKQINRVKELGLTHEQLRRIARESAAYYKHGSIDLEYVLRNATRLLSRVDSGMVSDAAAGAVGGRVITGREEE